jgi:hypothetical protein
MDWMQILREFGVPTLYAVMMLVYFFREQNFLKADVQQKITDMQAQLSLIDQKYDQIVECIEAHNDDVKSLGSITQEQIEVLNNISERIRDIFTYFINLLKRGEKK